MFGTILRIPRKFYRKVSAEHSTLKKGAWLSQGRESRRVRILESEIETVRHENPQSEVQKQIHPEEQEDKYVRYLLVQVPSSLR